MPTELTYVMNKRATNNGGNKQYLIWAASTHTRTHTKSLTFDTWHDAVQERRRHRENISTRRRQHQSRDNKWLAHSLTSSSSLMESIRPPFLLPDE